MTQRLLKGAPELKIEILADLTALGKRPLQALISNFQIGN